MTNEVDFEFSKGQKAYLFWKRLFDIVGSLLGIAILGVPMLIVAIIIKFSSKGPVMFRQERLGKDKKVFRICKFRSMKVGAPEIAPNDLDFETQKQMTYKFGNFMRKTSIDEWPQLFNILAGQMSFIGPRPGAAKNEEKLVAWREQFTPNAYMVKPGLGGYAIVNGGRNHNPIEKAEYDSYYVRHLSFGLDIKVFFLSAFVAFGLMKKH